MVYKCKGIIKNGIYSLKYKCLAVLCSAWSLLYSACWDIFLRTGFIHTKCADWII